MAKHTRAARRGYGYKASAWATVLLASVAAVACGQDPAFQERLASQGKSADSKVADDGGSGGSIDDEGMTTDGSPTSGLPGSETGAAGDGGDGGTGPGSSGDNPEELLLPGDGGGADWMPDWTDGDAEDSDTPAGPVDPTAPGGDGTPGSNPSDPNAPSNPANPNDPTTPGTGGDGTPVTPTPDIPAADDDDLDALHKCLAKWRNHPFTGTVYNYEKIAASISIGGYGNAINDTESTDEPFLVLVEAGVNVLGSTNYNLMNKNGYYCIKVNVNVLTTLNVNLHCNARLADSKVNVNVGSTQNDTTSGVGVHVLSTVNVNTVRPEGDTCIR